MERIIAVGVKGVSLTQSNIISSRLSAMAHKKKPHEPRVALDEMGIFLSNLRLDFKMYLESELDAAGRQFSVVLTGNDGMYTSGVLAATLQALYPAGEMVDDTIFLYDPKARLLFLMHVDLVLDLLRKDVESTPIDSQV